MENPLCFPQILSVKMMTRLRTRIKERVNVQSERDFEME